MNDTMPGAAAIVRAAILRAAPAERMREALLLSERMRALSLASLRTRHPDFTTLQLVELLLGEPLIPAHAAKRLDGA